MSSLRSGIEELQGEDLRFLGDEGLEARFVETERDLRSLEAEQLRTLDEIHRRETWRRDWYLSTTAWLIDRLRVGAGAAASRLRTARALAAMPGVRNALSSGEISRDAVEVLVVAREAHSDEFPHHEAVFVEAAGRDSIRSLRRAVAYWRQALDGPRALADLESMREGRRLHVSQTLGGMVRLDGDLDPETGETVMTALRAVVDAGSRSSSDLDLRSSSQRRADALGEMCRQWLDRADRPEVGGERPHLTVLVDLENLEGHIGRISELERSGPIHPEIVRRLACDATVSRVITKGRSEPLDVGRRTPVVSTAMRRALVVRDGGCAFPGCDRPPSWCDAHHIVPWAKGGATSLSNLMLLCRRHHGIVHEHGVRIEPTDSGPVFRRSDGSPIGQEALTPKVMTPW